MNSDRALLEKCLNELERPSGGAQALAAEIRERLKAPDPGAVEVGAPAGAPAPLGGADALWDTNKPPSA
jgi:hypothetical protein